MSVNFFYILSTGDTLTLWKYLLGNNLTSFQVLIPLWRFWKSVNLTHVLLFILYAMLNLPCNSVILSFRHAFLAAIGPRGIRVNSVNPAAVKTDMFNKPDGPGGSNEKKQAVSNDGHEIVEISVRYSDVIMSVMAPQITGISIVCSNVQVQIKESIKAPRLWPLWGESIGDRWIPLTKGQ